MAFVMLQAFDRHIKSIKKCIFSTILKKWILRHFNTGGRRTDASTGVSSLLPRNFESEVTKILGHS